MTGTPKGMLSIKVEPHAILMLGRNAPEPAILPDITDAKCQCATGGTPSKSKLKADALDRMNAHKAQEPADYKWKSLMAAEIALTFNGTDRAWKMGVIDDLMSDPWFLQATKGQIRTVLINYQNQRKN